MNNELTTPATEIDIAAALEAVTMLGIPHLSLTLRRLAFERDMLREKLNRLRENVDGVIGSIIDNWEDWDEEACQAAQQEQNSEAWRYVMRDNLRARLMRELEIENEKPKPLWHGSGVYIPKTIAICPECQGELTARSMQWDNETGRPLAAELDIQCVSDPDLNHRYWPSNWQPVRNAIAKWCGATVL